MTEQETVIFLEEVMDVLQLEITLELAAGTKGDLEQTGFQIGLWDLV
ncbi:beta-galactosidase [Streptococcus dysgalactiae subsp. dysgalactiae]|uniref:Beta-galactosidase n=1 Tax=Streptococcus dysgalactiae subsp. dysgalactiae TaxID=99822 RepID=A0A380JVW6_STRDY|nr:beta-galactosidase [Streptococcus dysgalactiae subsp. dysgalactiae]